MEGRQTRLPDGQHAIFVQRSQGTSSIGSLSDADLAEHLTHWPDVGTDGVTVLSQGGDWLISLAPAASIDLFVSIDSSGDVLLADRPAALLPNHECSTALDLEALVDRLSGSVTLEGTRTVHPGVFRIAGGEEVRVSGGRLKWRRWWEPGSIAIHRDVDLKRAATDFRAMAEAVVDRHLPPAGPVAVQLSGGRDSSLLCALAARRLAQQGRSVLALTALPCAGLPPAGEQHQYDESAGAVATATRFDNVEHLLQRPRPIAMASVLDRLHRLLGEPIHQPVSLTWSLPQIASCAERGIGILLTGDDGNFTVSAGGLPFLSDVWREEGALTWLRTGARLLGEGSVGLRDLVRVSFGAHLPLPLYRVGRKRGQPELLFKDYPFFKDPLRSKLLARTPDSDDPRPISSHRGLVSQVSASLYNLLPIGRVDHGVEMLAPWDDRGLFELVLSLPASLLASAPERRALFDLAFADLLPNEVLRPVLRGRQNVDFHAGIEPSDLVSGVERYRHSASCNEMIDLDTLARFAANWPTNRDSDFRHYGLWVGQFLPALSLASFLYTRDHPAEAG